MLAPLHLITAGSVDDGKSTLIGRLLLDTGAIFSDQLLELERISDRTRTELNLALFTDGLRAERQQGITIDAGYRYFRARDRKVILADTPGHLQFTRNMIAAASNAEAAVILVDANRGVTLQTHRHLLLANLVGVQQFVICINKIDLCGYQKKRFDELTHALRQFVDTLAKATYHYVPTSALFGDNIARASDQMPWYTGPTLLDLLETLPNRREAAEFAAFTVQSVIRSGEQEAKRIYAGRMLSGTIETNARLIHLPSRRCVNVCGIALGREDCSTVSSPVSAGIKIEEELDIARGDLFVAANSKLELHRSAETTLCWMSEAPLVCGRLYLFQQHTKRSQCVVESVTAHFDLDSNKWVASKAESLAQNEIGSATLEFSEELPLMKYASHRALGAGILIDPVTNETVAAAMITKTEAAQ